VETVEKIGGSFPCMTSNDHPPVENLWKNPPLFPQGIYTYGFFPQVFHRHPLVFHRFFHRKIGVFPQEHMFFMILNNKF
jgi:hypothetical protein